MCNTYGTVHGFLTETTHSQIKVFEVNLFIKLKTESRSGPSMSLLKYLFSEISDGANADHFCSVIKRVNSFLVLQIN